MSTTNDPTQNCCNSTPGNEEKHLQDTAKTNNVKETDETEKEKEKHSTPVIPYTGNEMLQGGRTRLTAEGEKPV